MTVIGGYLRVKVANVGPSQCSGTSAVDLMLFTKLRKPELENFFLPAVKVRHEHQMFYLCRGMKGKLANDLYCLRIIVDGKNINIHVATFLGLL